MKEIARGLECSVLSSILIASAYYTAEWGQKMKRVVYKIL